MVYIIHLTSYCLDVSVKNWLPYTSNVYVGYAWRQRMG